MRGPFVPDPGAVLTVPQVAAAIETLGIDPSNVLSVVIWPDHVSWETITEAGQYETHTARVAR